MNGAPIRIAIAADDALVRQLLRLTLAERGISVVAEADNDADLALLCRAEHPDVVLADDSLTRSDVTAMIRNLAKAGTDVLVVASDASVESANACLLAGAAGYVSANVSLDSLADAVRAVHAGGAPLDPWSVGPLLREWRELRAEAGATVASQPDLSPREREILQLIASGQSTKAVASTLALSAKTVETHKTRIFAKLGVRSQTEAVTVAIASGLLGAER